ncbi:MAG: acyl-CoA thioesterase [Clostridiales bacterium]|nr:acyl-CoA thioesterase [Clostridiales bacterium]
MKEYVCTHLVKSEDMNHHGTLFAGRMAEWFTESSFIAAASLYGDPGSIVCVKIHGMKFSKPINKGSILFLRSKVVHVGTTSIAVYTQANINDDTTVLTEGYVSFVCVDHEGKKKPHYLTLPEPENETELKQREYAKTLR